jgi:tetratricopeptide (TPR) repeat protein
MSLRQGKPDRRILPRWRDSKNALAHSEFNSLKTQTIAKIESHNLVDEPSYAFEQLQSIGTAAELISVARLSGNLERSEQAVAFVLNHQDIVPTSLLNLAKSIREKGENLAARVDSTDDGLNRTVTQTRHLLRLKPENPVLWSDMARHYAAEGDKKQAVRCMKTALSLAPDHRWMLRTAARFLVHQDSAVAAHKLIANHPRTKNDPWLIAAELACAQVASRPPKFWKQANDILKWERFAPLHTSELATAIAMMELEVGERKKARKFVQKALISPTENTLAQVFWAQENRHLNDATSLDHLVRSSADAYEAQYRMNMVRGEFTKALEAANSWMNDEPFAARPCVEIAFVASVLDDHDLTMKMGHRVRRIDGKNDPTFELNTIFARLSSGRLNLDHDRDELDSIRSMLFRMAGLEKHGYHALANLGLLLYRYGDPVLGRQSYQKAIEFAIKSQQFDAAAMAGVFAAREAILASDDSAATCLQEAKSLAGRAKNKAAEFYLRKLDALVIDPAQAQKILTPASTSRFLNSFKQQEGIRIEKGKDGQFTIWLPSKS